MDILELAETAPIANPEEADFYDEQYRRIHRKQTTLFRMWAGEGDSTHVYVWAGSFDDAFEEFAEWLDENAPGHLTDVTVDDLKEAAEALDIEWQEHWPDFEDRDFEKVAESAEADLTNIGHTTLKHGQYLRSWEWGGEEVHSEKERDIVLERSEQESHFDEEGDARSNWLSPIRPSLIKMLKEERADIPKSEDDVDVRLQVLSYRAPIDWKLHVGDASYDTDHHGYWGAAVIGRDFTNQDIADAAEILIDEAEEAIAADKE